MTNDRTDSSEAQPRRRPINDDPDAWRAYWEALGQPWRTEPEIDEERKGELARRRANRADPDRGKYPFERVELSRRDVEWLLATHEDGHGPVNLLRSEDADRQGLDLRGAILRTNLSHLPLGAARLEKARLEEAHLESAKLSKAHLEGAFLSDAHLEGALLRWAHLEDAHLSQAYLRGAELWYARLEGADLEKARLEGADLRKVHLERANLREARLGSKNMYSGHLKRIREWKTDFPEMLLPADLRGAFFDIETDLSDVYLGGTGLYLGDTAHIGPRLDNVHWGGANLTVVNWEEVKNLSDAYWAQRYRPPPVEEYKAAVRANRQLAVVLREQGLNEVADRFFYNSQNLQRKVFWLQPQYPQYLFSLFSWVLAGYGYRPWWTFGWYLGVIFGCSLLYWLLGMCYSDAIVGSVTAFHGRGLLYPHLTGGEARVAAVEAVLGLFIEVAFIATFTQRFFGK